MVVEHFNQLFSHQVSTPFVECDRLRAKGLGRQGDKYEYRQVLCFGWYVILLSVRPIKAKGYTNMKNKEKKYKDEFSFFSTSFHLLERKRIFRYFKGKKKQLFWVKLF